MIMILTQKCAKTLISKVLVISFSVCWNNGWVGIIPALLINMVTGPTSDFTFSANSNILSRLVTSQLLIVRLNFCINY